MAILEPYEESLCEVDLWLDDELRTWHSWAFDLIELF